MLTLNDIYAGYGKKEIIKGVSLSVDEGEILSIIGPNGAGKSTLLKVIAGLLSVSRGKIIFGDANITQSECIERIKKGIVYFLQGGEIFPGLTVSENLEIGANGVGGSNDNMYHEIFKLFPGIKNMLNRRAGLLSGGQRQQVALAMVLLKKPGILLLDEPSAGLAPNLVKETMAKVDSVNKNLKTTIVLVEQNVREVLKISARSLIIVNGKLMMETSDPKSWLNSNIIEEHFFEKSISKYRSKVIK